MSAEKFAKNSHFICGSKNAARLIGLIAHDFENPDFAKYFSGQKNLVGAEPLAMAYSGHQFGVWARQLGDGRALLLGQVRGKNKKLWDVQLKGSGLTPYSRMGDGRAVLRSCIREFLCSEAMFALKIPTSRALCIVGTKEMVQREKMEPGAILTRLSESHIRFGHFEHFFYNNRPELVKTLADYVIQQHYAEKISYENWFADIVTRTAKLIANWQAVGFAHGVMNTDNMSILGLTLDYGPFGFLEEFDCTFICNHSDHSGRYAFDQQPSIAFWNLHALAFALQPLIPFEKSKEILQEFEPALEVEYHQKMLQKIGLTKGEEADKSLLRELLQLMQENKSDYTLTLRSLAGVVTAAGQKKFLENFASHEKIKTWLKSYLTRLGDIDKKSHSKNLNQQNPKFILRNWVAETAIRAACDQQDYQPLRDILKILETPFAEHPKFEAFAGKAPQQLQNLCVSCSS